MFYYISIIHDFITAQDVIVILIIVTIVVNSSTSSIFLIANLLSFRFIVNLQCKREETINSNNAEFRCGENCNAVTLFMYLYVSISRTESLKTGRSDELRSSTSVGVSSCMIKMSELYKKAMGK